MFFNAVLLDICIMEKEMSFFNRKKIVAIFHKYISFCRLGSILKQTRRSLPQADLWILSFLSLKSLWLTKKYWFQNEFV